MAWRRSEEHGKQRHEASWGWESREANFTHNGWWADWRPGTETPSDCWVWMTPYSPWWRPASDAPLTRKGVDAARQGCPAHLEEGTWSSVNPSTQTLRFKREFKITVGALTYIYTYKEGIASDGKTILSGPELSVVASTTIMTPCSNYGRKGRALVNGQLVVV